MSQYQRLLLVINPDLRHSPAILHAAALAGVCAATLHITAFALRSSMLALLEKEEREKLLKTYLEDHQRWLDIQVKRLLDRGLSVTAELICAEDLPHDLLDYVKEQNPDLLIKDVEYESMLKRAFFTPLDWRLLRHSPVPVYLLGGWEHALPRKIVAAVDISSATSTDEELNDRIIRHASSLAVQCAADLHLLYACERFVGYLADVYALGFGDLMGALHRAEERALRDLGDRHGIAADHVHFVAGPAVSVLSQFAVQREVDMVVMGRVRPKGLEKWLGSTTEHVLYQVSCDVVAV